MYVAMLRGARAPLRGLRTLAAMAGGDGQNLRSPAARVRSSSGTPRPQHRRSATAALTKWRQGLILNERWMKVSSVLHQAETSARKKPGIFRKLGSGGFPLPWGAESRQRGHGSAAAFPGTARNQRVPGKRRMPAVDSPSAGHHQKP